jgi:hypothetical protein
LSVFQAQQPATTTEPDSSVPTSAPSAMKRDALSLKCDLAAAVDAPSAMESTIPSGQANPSANPAVGPEKPQDNTARVPDKSGSSPSRGKKENRSSKSNRKPPAKTLTQTSLFDNDIK